MPLRAITDGQEFFACDLNKQHREVSFECPICDDQLIPVLPRENIINHFRHKNNKAHGEPETPEHLAMKQQLRDMLGDSCKLEERIGDNIADVIYNGWAIECQCSSMGLNEFKTRNTNYRDNKYHPLWILGGKYYDNTQKFTRHPGGYSIQKIKKLELEIKSLQPLLYSDGDNYWESAVQKRFYAKTLGWYNMRPYEFLYKYLQV